MSLFLVFVFSAAMVAWAAVLYRNVRRYRAQVDNAWVQVDAQLEQRKKLATDLLNNIRANLNGQIKPLEDAVKTATAAAEMNIKCQAENELTSALNSFFNAVAEHDELRANRNFTTSRENLAHVCERISLASKFYNDQALVFNTRISIAPQSVIARLAGFKTAGFFDIHSLR